MLLLLGAGGYVGHAFANELLRRGRAFIPLTRRAIDYTSFNLLFDYIRKTRPEFVINAAGYTGKPDEADCEVARGRTLAANTLLPQTIARACLMTNTPWGHVSSGSIYAGAKIVENGRLRIERNLHRPELRELAEEHPEQILGFTESDEPNCCFRCPPCSFYSGTKALAEEVLHNTPQTYIWRPAVVFNEQVHPRNFLWRIQHSTQICNSVNSLSHVEDFVRACLGLWEVQAPFGTYNIANPGAITTQRVAQLIERILKPHRRFELHREDDLDYLARLQPPCSHNVLASAKLLAARVKIRPAEEALEEALHHWQRVTALPELVFH
jgi:dTDP-4-dehydrorhamnose reductase